MGAVPRDSGDDRALTLYLREVARHPLLSRDDEARLSERVRTGAEARARLEEGTCGAAARARLAGEVAAGEEARRCFVEGNLRLVVFVARRFESSGAPLLDLVQDGNLGLLRAVERFDGRKGFAFSTYATWWIRQAITRGLAAAGRPVSVPAHVAQSMRHLRTTRERLEHERGRAVTIEELADELGMPRDRAVELTRLVAHPLSLSQPLAGAEASSPLGDLVEDRVTIAPFDATARSLLASEVRAMLMHLTESERTIIELRYGLDPADGHPSRLRREPCTLEQIGRTMRLTRARIHQIEQRALRKLRQSPHGEEALALLTG
jgi:RNA polymerase sigma factor (sigma-70 family)